MVLGKLSIHVQKNESGPLSYTMYKISEKQIKDLNYGTLIRKDEQIFVTLD